MLETAIVGGGVCGLALARELERRGAPFALFDARSRLGGRVLSVPEGKTRVDLGPTWYWPDAEPLMARLVGELRLPSLSQHDGAGLLVLNDVNEKPEVRGTGVHAGARRLSRGMLSLVERLAAELAPERVHLAHVLSAVRFHAEGATLTFDCDGQERLLECRRLVLALPPRLVVEQVQFEPALSPALREALEQTPTWMATHAKAVVRTDAATWRDRGLSGNAFVTHEQAVFAEVFDACEPEANLSALGAFVALDHETRQRYAAGLPMLMDSQLTQLFGELPGARRHYQDWACERFTCSARDASEGPRREETGHPTLRMPWYAGRLLLAGTETASYASGHVEGALDAARRVRRELEFLNTLDRAGHPADAGAPQLAYAVNAQSLRTFETWAQTLPDKALADYRARLTSALHGQDADQLTQRALLSTVEHTYREALDVLETLPFDARVAPLDRGRSALTPAVQAAFTDFHPALLAAVVQHNRSSCALRNFAEEHELPRAYLQVIMADVSAAFREFSLSANAILAAKRI